MNDVTETTPMSLSHEHHAGGTRPREYPHGSGDRNTRPPTSPDKSPLHEGGVQRDAPPAPPKRSARDAQGLAVLLEETLRQDARFGQIRVSSTDNGLIDIVGSVRVPALLRLLREFAAEWGGIRVDVRIAPSTP
jgi:hypothetical protein